MVHNRYRSGTPSGENMAVDRQVEGLRAAGIEVVTYFRSSDEIEEFGTRQRVALGVRPIWSIEDERALKSLIESSSPDLVHLHNPYPLISPAVVRAAKAAGLPVVQSVHNLRSFCVNGLGFRDGHECRECRGRRFPTPAVRHACYQSSHASSLVMAAALSAHSTTWRLVDRFLPVSEQLKAELVHAGVEEQRISVVLNGIDDPGVPTRPGNGVLFAARLEEEKGVALLLDAWHQSHLGHEGVVLTIAGDGALRQQVENASLADPSINYLGLCDPTRVHAEIQSHRVLVSPSVWVEGLPTVVLEAMARGRPVIATSVGALANLVDDSVGWTVDPSPAQLAAALREAALDDHSAVHRGAAGRARFESRYLTSSSISELLRVYRDVSAAGRRRRVVVVTRRAPKYRVPFFNGLRAELDEHGVDLEVLVGGTDEGAARGDAGDLPWATEVPSLRVMLRGHEVVLQSVLRQCSDADLVVMEQAAKMVTNNLVLALGRRHSGPRTAFWGHGRNMNSRRRTMLGEWWKRATIRRVDWFFAYTPSVADYVVSMGLPREQVTDVRNSTDTAVLRKFRADITAAETASCREELGLGRGPVALYTGSLYAEKELGLLIDIGDHTVKALPDFHLVVVGDGPDRAALEEHAASRTWLHVVGTKFGRDLARIASTASLMLIPGAIGLVVVDAAALGLPVITTAMADHGVEIDYLEHGVNGLICPSNSLATASALLQLLSDPDELARLSEGACKLADQTTLESMVQRFAAGILACLDGRPSPDAAARPSGSAAVDNN